MTRETKKDCLGCLAPSKERVVRTIQQRERGISCSAITDAEPPQQCVAIPPGHAFLTTTKCRAYLKITEAPGRVTSKPFFPPDLPAIDLSVIYTNKGEEAVEQRLDAL